MAVEGTGRSACGFGGEGLWSTDTARYELIVAPYAEPDFLPWDGRRVPMTFLAGYLGAGKTTVLNELLAVADRPIVVLVNDVGEVNIDAALIRRRNADTIELTDGCICCSLSDGFAAAIDGLRSRPQPPDHVVIELSGVAEPSRVLPWSGSAGFKLDGVVTLVDSAGVLERLADPLSELTITSQLRDADLIVLTKLDLVDEATVAEVERAVAALSPTTPIIRTGREAIASLLNVGGRRDQATAVPPATLFDRHEMTAVPLPRPIDEETLAGILLDLPPNVVRAKGIAESPDGERLLIQVVGRRRSITPLPAAEDEPPTDLVVIALTPKSI
jgi:G3E family GTPase